jgi:hypothetical protein
VVGIAILYRPPSRYLQRMPGDGMVSTLDHNNTQVGHIEAPIAASSHLSTHSASRTLMTTSLQYVSGSAEGQRPISTAMRTKLSASPETAMPVPALRKDYSPK